MSIYIHSTAEVSPKARLGDGVSIWNQSQVREGAMIGCNCILSKDVYIDAGVQIGDNVKIQNGVSVYHGVTLEDGVFCGPHCVFTNDQHPRAIKPDGTLKGSQDWTLSQTLVKTGASIGAGAVIVCGVTIGRWAMVGAGAVVTHNVPDHGLVYGNPARLHGFVCPCGETLPLSPAIPGAADTRLVCLKCQVETIIPAADYAKLAYYENRPVGRL